MNEVKAEGKRPPKVVNVVPFAAAAAAAELS